MRKLPTIGFAIKQRKLQLNRFCNKTTQIPSMPQQNSVNHSSKISPFLKFLHMTQNFSTDIVRGVRDKYEACVHVHWTCMYNTLNMHAAEISDVWGYTSPTTKKFPEAWGKSWDRIDVQPNTFWLETHSLCQSKVPKGVHGAGLKLIVNPKQTWWDEMQRGLVARKISWQTC